MGENNKVKKYSGNDKVTNSVKMTGGQNPGEMTK